MTATVWDDRPTPTPFTDLDSHDGPLDDVVVGAGLAGLATGLLLARAGRRVAVVEARRRGAVTTGHSSAKLSLLQGTKLSRMRRHHSARLVSAYVEANREALAWVLGFCEEQGVAVQRRPAVTYAADDSETGTARDEERAALEAGLPVRWVEDLDVPVPHRGGVLLDDQAQLDPLDLVEALARELRAAGGMLHEGRRVVDVARDGRQLTLDDGRVLATSTIVLATGAPVLDRGLGFAKLEAARSYVTTFTGAEPPHPMLLSAGSPGWSLRSVERPDGSSRLMVGGAGHVVGRAGSEQAHLDALRDFATRHYPGATETHAWSAQDYGAVDGVPWIGPLPRGRGRILVASGFDKWGMTNAVVAALSNSAEILQGSPPPWQRTMRHRITGPGTAAGVASMNLRVGLAACAAAPGIGRRPLCTHLGGVLRRNDAEGTWDCPLHGSRFADDGSVLEGPATKPLRGR